MKLYYTSTSPFVRKVLVVAHETAQAESLETTFLRPNPTQPDAGLSLDNPLSKIPVLITDEVGPLYDSGVICEYLDSKHEGPKIIPASGAARWRALRVQALADGILDASILVFYERSMRPVPLHWADWIHGQSQKALQGLDALEQEVATFDPDVKTADLAQICVGAAIGWIELRGIFGDVRTGRPALFAWYDRFVKRPSMQATLPHA